MFGRFIRRSRRSSGRGHNHGGRKMHGRRCGHMGSRHGYHHCRHDHYHYFDEDITEESYQQQAAPAFISGDTTEGFCPLCKNHCPLTAPSCRKGEAYAASNLNN